MANRTYLYACDRAPGGARFTGRGLSEYAWDIPLIFRVMMANEPRVVRSAIWPHDIGILARREGAFERALALLDKVGEGTLPKRAAFDRALAEMKAFLAAVPPSAYLLLEAGEIFDVMDGELDELVASLAQQIPMMAAVADRAIAGKEDKWLAGLRKKWPELANPGEWSNVLYFDLSPTKPAKKPAKAKPAAKKPSATKPATKKPATKKPAAKKPAAKKPATKKPAAKKPAAKKPAAKPPAAKKPRAR